MRAVIFNCLVLIGTLASPYAGQSPLGPDWLASAVGTSIADAIPVQATADTDGAIRIRARSDRIEIGDVTCSAVRLGGQLRMHTDGRSLVGEIEIRAAELRVAGGLVRIDDLKATVSVGPAKSRVHVTARLGSRPIEAEGSFTGRIDRTKWDIASLDLRVRGDRVLILDDEDVRLRAAVDLRLKAHRGGGSLTGEITAQSGRFLRDLEPSRSGAARGTQRLALPTLDSDWGHGLTLSVRLRSAQPLVVDSRSFDARVEPELTIAGTADAPRLTGRIRVVRGTYYAVTGSMPLERGEVRFTDRDPGRPYLDAVAVKRVAGFEVRVTAVGPVDAVQVDYSSSPPLPHEDIASLLALGGLRTDQDSRAAAEAAGLLGLRYAYAQLFPRKRGSDPTWFDDLIGRLEIQTVPARTPRDATSQIRALVRIAPSLYLRAERDRYAETNFDVLYRLRFGKPRSRPRPNAPPRR